LGGTNLTKLILIAAAGMDWTSFDASTRSGALPQLARLRDAGFAGSLTGVPVGEGLAAYASMVTGVQPETHGVWRTLESWGGGLRATGRASWRAAPVWTRLEAAGISTGSVGWPAIRPGADWPGLHLDETFAEPTGKNAADWALPLSCAPPQVRDAIIALRVHPTQITTDAMLGFIPELAKIDQTRPTPIPALALAIARAATNQAGAVWMLNDHGPDAVFLFHGLLGQVRAAAQSPARPEYTYATKAAWRFTDALIGRVADVAGKDALVLVVSPGWRGEAGVVLAAGGGGRNAPDFLGADLLDIAPTVLGYFGRKAADLPGRPLAPLSGDTPLAEAPLPPLAEPVEPDADLLGIAAKNGFPPPAPPSPAWRAQGLAELAFMLLRRSPEGAATATAEALRLDPDNVMAMRIRATGLFALEQADELLEVAEALERTAPHRGWGALARGAHHILRKEISLASPWLMKAEADSDIETKLTVAAAWLIARRSARAERLFKEAIALDDANVPAEIGIAVTAMSRRDFRAAEAALKRAIAHDPGRAAIYQTLAQVYDETGRQKEAERMTEIARRLGPVSN
jgi:tetratricopeptide (TPR) repeat protein